MTQNKNCWQLLSTCYLLPTLEGRYYYSHVQIRKLRHRDLVLKPSTIIYRLPCLRLVCPALLVLFPSTCLILVIISPKLSSGVIVRLKRSVEYGKCERVFCVVRGFLNILSSSSDL